eukprot:Phypoly_transcript_05255.p1 GENE.Phypoly_transcript_05255~~Phypoly_transcript_05255.p1  ORF type:complete len:563 (+),score=75.83 Phypoly_transcript_05255:228-1916(+)
MASDKVEISLSSAESGGGIACHRTPNVGIAIKATKQGKTWTTTRSEEEFKTLHHNLEREFSGVLTIPDFPTLPTKSSDPLATLQSYLSAIANHPSIKTSDFLKKFIDLKDENKVAPKTSKRGLLTLKDGKKKYEATIENRVLSCIGQKSGVCELAVLLDNCEVTPEDDSAFILNSGKPKDSNGKRRSLVDKINSNSIAMHFTAFNRDDRDEWIDVIHNASQIFKEATFTVSGRLTVQVVEGKDLAPKDFNLIRANTSDPYVVLIIERQQAKSRTIDRNLNPVWNEEFSFDITQNQGILFVQIYDEDLLSRSDSMGQVVVPLSGISPGVFHDMWLTVLPRKPYEKISGKIRLRVKYDFVKEEAPAKMGPIFGMNLQEICDNPRLCSDGVPKFFAKFLAFLEEKAMNEEGIFRISGSFSQVKEIKQKVDEGQDISCDTYDIHSISGVLKLYLRELPVPLFTYENYTKLIELSAISNEKEMMNQLKMVMVVLPPAHISILKLLLPSLKKFSENSKVNMMTTSNLAIVFGPSLIRPQVDSFETVLHTVNINALTTLLITQNINIFN